MSGAGRGTTSSVKRKHAKSPKIKVDKPKEKRPRKNLKNKMAEQVTKPTTGVPNPDLSAAMSSAMDGESQSPMEMQTALSLGNTILDKTGIPQDSTSILELSTPGTGDLLNHGGLMFTPEVQSAGAWASPICTRGSYSTPPTSMLTTPEKPPYHQPEIKAISNSGSNPPSLADIMSGVTVLLQEQEVRMKDTIENSRVVHSSELKQQEERIQSSIVQSLADHSAVVANSMTSLETRVDVKLTGYDAAMGKLTSDNTTINQAVKGIQGNLTSQKTALDKKLSDHAEAMKKEIKELKDLVASTQKTRTPHKAPYRPFATTFDSEILIDGIEEERNEVLVDICQERVFSILEVQFDPNQIECAYRIGKELSVPDEATVGPRRRPRSICVKFAYPSCKDICIKRSYKLRGHKLFINQHYSPRIERQRKRLYPILKKARGIEAYRDKISLEDEKIILHGKAIGVDDFDSLPDDIHPRDICTETIGNVTFFFRTDSPLSNHHICKIEMGGKRFNSVEQAYFHRKAEICKDDWSMGRIMAAKAPGVQKGIGEKIPDTPEWISKKLAVMRQICEEKFKQNAHLSAFLLKTGTTLLAEDNPQDSYFGIGLSRNSPRSRDQKNFKTNHLGHILMSIRSSLPIVPI
jgi:hypothetical protein